MEYAAFLFELMFTFKAASMWVKTRIADGMKDEADHVYVWKRAETSIPFDTIIIALLLSGTCVPLRILNI